MMSRSHVVARSFGAALPGGYRLKFANSLARIISGSEECVSCAAGVRMESA
jgi:hypothetical protein